VAADTSAVHASLQAIADLVEPVTVPVAADTSAVHASLDRLRQDLAPVSVPVDVSTAPVDDFGAYAAQTLPPQFAGTGEDAGSEFGAGFTRTVTGIFRTTSLALGAFLAGSLIKGYQRLTTIEDATASLTVALGSAAEAAEVLDEVLGVVRGTPFNLDQFAEAASNMISFGIEAEKVPGYLTAIGEAAASKGGRANEFAQRLSITFGQIAVQGRITNEDIQSLQLTGVDALGILGNAFEQTSFEMREMISKGIIPADEALDALADGIIHGSDGINGATVAFEGTMANLRETLTGAIGGFGSATARFGVAIIRPFQELLTDGFNAASEALDVFGAAVEENLSGFAESDAMMAFRDILAELPELAEDAIDAFKEFGPALAPIAAITAGLGLQSLSQFLGPFGSLLPGITGPIGALTVGISSLVAVTPELREKAIPVIQELFSIVAEVGGGIAEVTADLIDGLIPALSKLIDVVDSLLPLIRGIGLGSVVVFENLASAIGGLASVLSLFPTEALAPLAAFFVAYKGFRVVEGAFLPLRDDLLQLQQVAEASPQAAAALESSYGPTSKAARGLNRFGLTAESTAQIVSGAMVTATGAISGFALASEDAAAQITGGLGAISSIALGFSQGPIAGAFATAGVGIGFIAGQFLEARQEAEKLKREMEDLADVIIEEVDGVILALDDLDAFDFAAELGLIGDNRRATEAFIEGLGEDFIAALNEADLQGFDILDLDPSVLEPTISILGEMETAALAVNTATGYVNENFELTGLELAQLASGVLDPDDYDALLAEAIETVNTGLQDQAGLLLELEDLTGFTIDPTDEVHLGIVKDLLGDLVTGNEALAEAYGVSAAAAKALQSAQEKADAKTLRGLGVSETFIQKLIVESRELWEINADGIFELNAAGERFTPIQLFEERELGFDPLNIQNMLGEVLRGGVDVLFEANDATEEVVDSTEAWAAALEGVLAPLGQVDSLLGQVTSRGNAISAIQGIDGFLSKIVNESELRQAERVADQIDRQYDRIKSATDRLQEAATEFQYNEQIALKNIEEAEAAGADKIALKLRGDLEGDRLRVQQLAEDVAEEERQLAKLQGEAAGLSTVPITMADLLADQAAELGVSLGELILTQPTEESRAAWKALASGPLKAIVGAVEAAALDDPAVAAGLLETLIGQWTGSLPGIDVGEVFADLLVLTDDAKIGLEAKQAAEVFNQVAQGELSEEDALLIFKTSLSDADYTAAELQTFEDALALLEPTIPVGFELAEGAVDDLQEQMAAVLPTETIPIGGTGGERFRLPGGGLYGVDFFKEGGIRPPENHVAQIARDTIRVFAEPETGGEAYIPLAPSKRDRSERILGDVATMFGLELDKPRRDVAMPGTAGPTTAVLQGADTIADKVADGVTRAMVRTNKQTMASEYAGAVHIEKLIVGDASSQTRRRLIDDLADLSLRRRRR
jgi:tape measure domain-containing protein